MIAAACEKDGQEQVWGVLATSISVPTWLHATEVPLQHIVDLIITTTEIPIILDLNKFSKIISFKKYHQKCELALQLEMQQYPLDSR